ncbi:DNA-directed DNA/RNA polymerase mu [Erysiphe neolycopersici]|uniref:DNA polymerase lambda n=1 Tax=Erysiphe neolycopersici TaxID=212602 RepID=A0A420HL17_9PEZI|nr:DNA-directed DNA/RNA polymerase mu [Erysiphe neolycopersici]
MSNVRIMATDKFEYFNQLQALQECSDDEPELNELRRYMRDVVQTSCPYQKNKSHHQKYPKKLLTPQRVSKTRNLPTSPNSKCVDKDVQSSKKALMRRKISVNEIVTPITKNNILEPPTAQSFVEETPQILWQKTAQLGIGFKQHINLETSSTSQNHSPVSPHIGGRHENLSNDNEISTPVTNELFSTSINEVLVPNSETVDNRKALIPSIGSVVMNNSSGIKFMLRKRKRKSPQIKLVSEKDRIFAGQTFLFIPTNDIAPLRRKRIAKARSFGALWTKEWSPSVTHIIVDKSLNYKEMMAYLKPMLGSESIPSNVIFVNDEYPNECANFRCILDPFQERYTVIGSEIMHQQKRSKNPIIESNISEKISQINEITSYRKVIVLEPSDEDPNRDRQQTVETKCSSEEQISASTKVTSKDTTQDDLEISFPENQLQMSQNRCLLDEMLDVARNLKHLPIDDEDDEYHYQFQPYPVKKRIKEDSQKTHRESKRHFEKSGKDLFRNENFLCMEDGKKSSSETNPNTETIHLLKELSDYYDRIHDEWRSKGYRKAIRTLKRHPVKVSSYNEAIQLPNIGHRLAQKIEEIALTHRLRRLDSAKMSPEDELLQKFLKIYGVGLCQASKWISAGHKTLEDLKTRVNLTENQRLGIEHYNDFNTRIPRAEVTAMRDIIQDAVLSLDPQYEISIAGSYRRGAATCGDIDVIITRQHTREAREITPFLLTLVEHLTKDGFLVAALVKPGINGSKWHGACVMPGSTVWRRIDFLAVPAFERGAALLYFTGDDIFNRSIRLLCQKKGMRLNQHGLYRDVMRRPGGIEPNKGTLVESADERRIFEILGIPWRPPEQRSHN